MHRIDTDGLNSGQFSNGNPATGQLGTRLDAAWYQAMQEAICRAIERANIALVKGDDDQLYRAIVAIATGVGGGGGAGAGSVPTTRQVASGGLVTGGGDLTGDRTLTVAKASAADINAGQRDDAAVTPAGLAAAVGNPAGESFTYPNGRIVKEGEVRANLAPGVYVVAFATPFPTRAKAVKLLPVNSTGSGNRDTWVQLTSKDVNGFAYTVQTSSTGGDNGIDGIDWEVSGY